MEMVSDLLTTVAVKLQWENSLSTAPPVSSVSPVVPTPPPSAHPMHPNNNMPVSMPPVAMQQQQQQQQQQLTTNIINNIIILWQISHFDRQSSISHSWVILESRLFVLQCRLAS
jgi:hypothetical protein